MWKAGEIAEFYRKEISQEQVIMLVAKLLTSFAGQGMPAEAQEARASGFVIALEGIPVIAVQAACEGFLRGDEKIGDGAFAPTPPQLASVARRIRDQARATVLALRELASVEIDESIAFDENGEEAQLNRDRVAKMILDLANEMRKKNAPAIPTDDDLERLKRETLESLRDYQASEEVIKTMENRYGEN